MAAADNIGTEMNRLKQGLDDIQTNLGSLLTAVKELGTEQGRSVYERTREIGEHAQNQAQAAQRQVEHYVRESPLPSILVAFSVGVAIGVLLGRLY